MSIQCLRGRDLQAVLLFVVLFRGGATMHSRAQSGHTTSSVTATENAPAYEVVSIKRAKPGSTNASTQALPNGYRSINMPIESLVMSAYRIGPGVEISSLPEWARSDRYDIQAKVDESTAEAWKKLPSGEIWKQQRAMMRTLLAARCKLEAHWETKEGPVYDLVIAKGGLKMKEASPNETSHATGGGNGKKQHLTAHAETVEFIAGFVSGDAGRKIVDKTGLGVRKFDYQLDWTPNYLEAGDDMGLSIFTALREQLGLKLVSAKGPIETLVIDRIERPTPN